MAFFSYLRSNLQQGNSTNPSITLDTTGSGVLFVSIKSKTPSGLTFTFSDSIFGNTWNALTTRTVGTYVQKTWYCLNPITNASHTVQVTASANMPNYSLEFHAFGGKGTFQSSSGASASATSIQPGSITPTKNGALIFFSGGCTGGGTNFPTIDSGLTAIYGLNGGSNIGLETAYLFQSSAAAINPTYSAPTASNISADMIVIIPSVVALTLSQTNTLNISILTAITKFILSLSQHQTLALSAFLHSQLFQLGLTQKQTLAFSDGVTTKFLLSLINNTSLLMSLVTPGTIQLALAQRNDIALGVPGVTLINLSLSTTQTISEQGNSGPVSTPTECVNQDDSGALSSQISLVCDGDSLTAGYYGSLTSGNYPQQLGQLIQASRVLNLGVAGNTISRQTGFGCIQDHSVPELGTGQNLLILFGGTNDLLLDVPVLTITTAIANYVASRTAAGYKVIVLTIPPNSYSSAPLDYESKRLEVNAVIQASYPYVDIASDPRLANPGAVTSDGLHYLTFAYGYIAQDSAFRLIQLGFYA